MKLTLLPTFYLSLPPPTAAHSSRRHGPTLSAHSQTLSANSRTLFATSKKPALPAGSLNLTLTNLHRAPAFPFTNLSAPSLDPLHRTIQTPSSF